MRTVQLGVLRTKARQRADMENSQFVSDSEMNSYISDSAAELYDLLIAAGAFYALSSVIIPVTSGVDTYALPDGTLYSASPSFYKLAGVDLVLDSNGNAITLKPFQFAERNSFLFTPTWNAVGLSATRYCLVGNNIEFRPVPSQSNSIKLWYAPVQAPLVNDTDTIDGINGWEEYVVIDAAIKALIKEESDVSVLMAQKQMMLKRIEEMSIMRNIADPDKVQDVNKSVGWEFWQFGGYR